MNKKPKSLSKELGLSKEKKKAPEKSKLKARSYKSPETIRGFYK